MELELKHKQISLSDPWLVAQTLEDKQDDVGDNTFFNKHDLLCQLKCQIPELVGKRIQGCLHGWMVLSNDVMWSFWNPFASEIISVPPLILRDGKDEDKEDHGTTLNNVVDKNRTSARNERDEEDIVSHFLDIPVDVLGKIMEKCDGVECFNFRATCKNCQLALPISRLKTCSFDSPLLMVLDKHNGLITFTDPMFGDNYYKKTPQELTGDLRIHSSKYGWLLIEKYEETQSHLQNTLMFYNPFTSDIHELPQVSCVESFCFSEPPTSLDCMVAGFGKYPYNDWQVYIHFVGREPSWQVVFIDHLPACPYSDHSLCFPTFYGRDLYALFENGGLALFDEIEDGKDLCWGSVLSKPLRSCSEYLKQYFLVKCDQHFMLVIVGEYGESVEVFVFDDSTKKWEETGDLGRHMVYVCDTTCLCIEAKIPEMENKIYFPRLHSKSGKIVFYSLETRMYHTSNGKNIEEKFEDLYESKYHQYPHSWIEPSWS